MGDVERVWRAAMAVGVCAGASIADPPLDCYGASCSFEPPILRRGHPDGIPDELQCLADWNRDTWIDPSDVAFFVQDWFYSANNPDPYCTTADLNCDGAATPADVALFIQYWYARVMAGGRCP